MSESDIKASLVEAIQLKKKYEEAIDKLPKVYNSERQILREGLATLYGEIDTMQYILRQEKISFSGHYKQLENYQNLIAEMESGNEAITQLKNDLNARSRQNQVRHKNGNANETGNAK